LKCKGLWTAVLKLTKNKLNLKSSTVKQALLSIYNQKRDLPAWKKLKHDMLQQWLEVNDIRIRAQARAISQTMLKSPTAPWLLQLLGKDGPDGNDSGSDEDSEEETPRAHEPEGTASDEDDDSDAPLVAEAGV
jgi:hypothetical protein